MQADANQGALTHISTPSIACVFLFYGNTQEHVIFYYPLQLDLSCIMALFLWKYTRTCYLLLSTAT
jgi:hypothetical protein